MKNLQDLWKKIKACWHSPIANAQLAFYTFGWRNRSNCFTDARNSSVTVSKKKKEKLRSTRSQLWSRWIFFTSSLRFMHFLCRFLLKKKHGAFLWNNIILSFPFLLVTMKHENGIEIAFRAGAFDVHNENRKVDEGLQYFFVVVRSEICSFFNGVCSEIISEVFLSFSFRKLQLKAFQLGKELLQFLRLRSSC